jgi:Tol biopolymer transport system component
VELVAGGERRPLRADPGQVGNPRYSADGRLVAYQRGGVGFARIWIHEVETSRESAIAGQANQVFPVWTPDGRLVYFSLAEGGFTLFLYDPRTAAEATVLFESSDVVLPSSASSAGVLLFFKGNELWQLDLARPGSAVVWLGEQVANATFSPDGRWVAYDAQPFGRWEVYVRPFPGPGAARPVSAGGGAQPAWRADGRGLHFISPRGLEVIDVRGVGGDLEFGSARLLFELPSNPDFAPRRNYDVSPDGRAFVTTVRKDQHSRMTVVLGLTSEMEDGGRAGGQAPD